jgi:hypothetical protein
MRYFADSIESVASYSVAPNSGVFRDWAYGEFGIAAFTFEVGHPNQTNCVNFDANIWPEDKPALDIALKLARKPIELSAPPAVRDLVATVNGSSLVVTAVADDTMNMEEVDQEITGARYSIDTPSWDGGTTANLAFTLTANISVANISDTIDISALSSGQHILYVEALDPGTYGWGAATAVFFNKP